MVKSEHKIQSEPSKPMTPPSSSTSKCNKNKNKYKGVRMRRWGSWVSEIRAPNQKTRIWLGSYSTPEAAARAYDAALLCLKGPTAFPNLNFPNNSNYYIPNPISPINPKSIQRIAANAANNSPPHHPPPPVTCSVASSPSTSSSPISGQLFDDIISLTPSLESGVDNFILMADEGWLDMSPKYIDPIMGSTFFDPIMDIEEFYEEGDIPLWSFCESSMQLS